jgi:hypothetical protein
MALSGATKAVGALMIAVGESGPATDINVDEVFAADQQKR